MNRNTNENHFTKKQSVWSSTATLPSFPHLEEEVKTDVLIIGGGIAGLLCAYMLQQQGIDYILAEANTICSGITKNTTAKITAQHGLIYDKLLHQYSAEHARMYLEANELALRQYQTICQTLDCDFESKDAYVYSTGSTEHLMAELKTLERIGGSADYAETLPLPFAVNGAIRFPNQAQFHPLKFAAAIARTLNIYDHTKILSFDGQQFHTPLGTISAKKTIVATHFPLFNKHGSYFLKQYQHRSYVLALQNAPDVDGMYIDENENGFSFRNHNGLLLIGGGAHRTGKPSSGWETISAIARQYYPEAQETYRWAAQDCMTLDGIPYIGQYSGHTPNLYVATGFNKWGFTSAMTAAMLLADLIQEKENPYTALFSPQRSIWHRQLFSNMLESTVNLLTLTNPRCPHLGCALKWNAQEHSWDCPCHGSRFDADGNLLDNPATENIKLKH